MTSVAFSGVQNLHDDQYLFVSTFVRRHVSKRGNNHFITGAATGVDTLCHYLCYAWAREAKHTIVVPNSKYNIEVVQFAIAMDLDVIYMPEGTDPLDRNTKMIEMAHILVAFPGGSKELYRGSGTWSTIRRARKKGIPIYIYPLDKSDSWRENV